MDFMSVSTAMIIPQHLTLSVIEPTIMCQTSKPKMGAGSKSSVLCNKPGKKGRCFFSGGNTSSSDSLKRAIHIPI